MKATLLTLLAVVTLTLTGCVVPYDGSYSGSYSYNSYGYNVGYQTANQPYYQNQSYVNVVGPQYNRAYEGYNGGCNNQYNTQYRNYSNAPVIVERPGRTNIIVPKSWD